MIPADVARWSARGSNRLLQGQATALLAPEDLIAHLGCGPQQHDAAERNNDGLLKALGDGAGLDELIAILSRPAASLLSDLISLELSGRVVCESGFRWKLSQR